MTTIPPLILHHQSSPVPSPTISLPQPSDYTLPANLINLHVFSLAHSKSQTSPGVNLLETNVVARVEGKVRVGYRGEVAHGVGRLAGRCKGRWEGEVGGLWRDDRLVVSAQSVRYDTEAHETTGLTRIGT
jgi:hypothetical protein